MKIQVIESVIVLSTEEQKVLIEKFVKSNKNFVGNEDLFEDFCAEALQKSYMVFNSTANVQKIEGYLSKVVHTSILGVLKDYGRVRRERSGYVATKEVKVADFSKPQIQIHSQTAKEEDIKENNSNNTVSGINPAFILDFPDPKETAEEVLITKDCIQRIVDAVFVINKEKPSEQFLDIFYLRYVKDLKQAEIGDNLGLSQSEVSKRLMRLSKLISNVLDK